MASLRPDINFFNASERTGEQKKFFYTVIGGLIVLIDYEEYVTRCHGD